MLVGTSHVETELIAQRPKGLKKEFNLSTTRSVKQEDQLLKAQRRVFEHCLLCDQTDGDNLQKA